MMVDWQVASAAVGVLMTGSPDTGLVMLQALTALSRATRPAETVPSLLLNRNRRLATRGEEFLQAPARPASVVASRGLLCRWPRFLRARMGFWQMTPKEHLLLFESSLWTLAIAPTFNAFSLALINGHSSKAFSNSTTVKRLVMFDVTLVVERPWRNKGLGWALLGAAMEWVRHSETRTIRMVFSRDNWPMRALAHKANAQLTRVFDEICASITVMPNPTYQEGTALGGFGF
jgi:GNAT superfamily N-acetyltransferase